MYELSPPESVHALDLEKLRKPEITFWSAWEGSLLLGCGALKELDRKHGEVKSMRTPTALRRTDEACLASGETLYLLVGRQTKAIASNAAQTRHRRFSIQEVAGMDFDITLAPGVRDRRWMRCVPQPRSEAPGA
jgi:hypothetical protein